MRGLFGRADVRQCQSAICGESFRWNAVNKANATAGYPSNRRRLPGMLSKVYVQPEDYDGINLILKEKRNLEGWLRSSSQALQDHCARRTRLIPPAKEIWKMNREIDFSANAKRSGWIQSSRSTCPNPRNGKMLVRVCSMRGTSSHRYV